MAFPRFKSRKKTQGATSANGAAAPEKPSVLSPKGDMSFLDHLEELRWRIFKALGAIVLGAAICTIFAEWVIDVLLLGPTKPTFFMYEVFGVEATAVELQNRVLAGQFFAYIGTVLVVGIILAIPVVLYQAWAFIAPGLYAHEKSGMRFSSVFATFFFVLGTCFGYLILTPLATQFLVTFTISDVIVNEIDITNYFSMVTMWSLGAGILFELPVVIYFLSKVGMVTPAILRKSRKYSLIAVLIIAAFLTPPDPWSQLIMAVPLFGLYEGSILISAVVNKRRQKAIDAALA